MNGHSLSGAALLLCITTSILPIKTFELAAFKLPPPLGLIVYLFSLFTPIDLLAIVAAPQPLKSPSLCTLKHYAVFIPVVACIYISITSFAVLTMHITLFGKFKLAIWIYCKHKVSSPARVSPTTSINRFLYYVHITFNFFKSANCFFTAACLVLTTSPT